MIRSVESTGTTIDTAIENALKQIGMDRDDVTVEIIEKPKTGFFGIGASCAVVRVSFSSEPSDRAKVFVEGLLEELKVDAKVEAEDLPDNNITINLKGENMNFIIGRRGDTLDAIQFLTSLAINKGEEKYHRVMIDTENYRKKREESLERLANKIAGKVVKYKKSMALEPMNPYERKIIHAALQNYRGITTYSTGSEPNRRIVVALSSTQKKDTIDKKTIS